MMKLNFKLFWDKIINFIASIIDMLDILFFRSELKRKYLIVALFSFLISSASILFVSKYVNFGNKLMKGLLALFFSTLALSYSLIRYARFEEHKEEREITKGKFRIFGIFRFKVHEILTYLSFFLGIALSYLVTNFFIPQDFFDVQKISICSIAGVCPNISTGFSASNFSQIFWNNTGVFILTFILSFFFTGAFLFILAWNASIFGIFLSMKYGALSVYYGLFYLPHGILEIASYIVAGLSGNFFSHELERFFAKGVISKKILYDIALFLVMGYMLVILGAFIEVL